MSPPCHLPLFLTRKDIDLTVMISDGFGRPGMGCVLSPEVGTDVSSFVEVRLGVN